ncbi:MAG: hypothetical protein WC900_08775 [Oscillospiraceae bacterium]|jgi:hypothetical protein
MNILDLFAHIGLKADTGPANEFLKTITGTQGQLLKVVASTLSFATAIKTMNAAFNDALGLAKFEQNTGMSSEAMQRWTQVADQVNGAGASVAATLDAIAANQEKIKFGEGNISGYQLLGIDPKQNPIDILEQIRTKSAGLPNEMRRNIAQEFGVSRDLVATLELTNEQFSKMSQNAFVIPESSIQGLMRARAELVQLKNQIKFTLDEAVVKALPLIETAEKWIMKIVTAVSNAGIMIDRLVKYTIGWKNAIIGLIGIFALLNASFLASPIGLFTIGIISLIAVLDDLYVYSSGKGKSIMGYIVNKFPAVGKAFQWLTDLVQGLVEILKFIFTGNTDSLDKFIDKWSKLGGIFTGIANAIKTIKDFFSNDKTGKKPAWLDNFKAMQGPMFDVLLKSNPFTAPIANIKDLIVSLFSDDTDGTKKDSKKPTGKSNPPAAPKENIKSNSDTSPSADIKNLAANLSLGGAKKDIKTVSGNTTSSVENNYNFTVNVSGADNPEATGEAVADHVQKKLTGVQTNRAGSKTEK